MTNKFESGHEALNPEVKYLDRKNYLEIARLLSEKGLSPTEIKEITDLVFTEVADNVNVLLNPEIFYDAVGKKAGSEWRDIRELGVMPMNGLSLSRLTEEIEKRFPEIETRIGKNIFKVDNVEVRRKNP